MARGKHDKAAVDDLPCGWCRSSMMLFLQEELLHRISQKLDVLRAEQLSLKEEMSLNESLGLQVSAQ